MRQIILDTETTGLSPSQGHRIIEIGCVELVERQLTGRHFHVYLDPQRKVDEGAFRVHGISDDFLKGKPVFSSVVDEFIAYIKGAELVIHNAPFDVGFLNHELKLHDKKSASLENYATVLDTLALAKQKHPGKKNNLDALCKRYGVDNSNRDLHGALLDAEILAHVYLAMTGGQEELFIKDPLKVPNAQKQTLKPVEKKAPLPVIKASAEELSAHQQLLALIAKKSGRVSVWESLDEPAKNEEDFVGD